MSSPPPASKDNSVTAASKMAPDNGKYRIMAVQRGKGLLLYDFAELLSCTWSGFEGNSPPCS